MTQPALNEELKVLASVPARLRSALNQADAATLLLVLVQFTGESEWLEKARPYIAGPMSYQEKMPPELRQAIRARLFDVLMERAASAAPLPALPEGALLSDMLSIAAGEPLGDEYLRMMSEELAPTPEELPMFEAMAPGLDAPADFRVLIIGAGMSGLCAAVRLKQAGVNFSIIEKNATVGGTWLENSYPGCGVDTPNHFYSYSFAPYHDWSMLFAKRRELWEYFERVADEYAIRELITFDTEVESAVFDENSKLWQVVSRGADGSRRLLDANVVISCVGVLNRPKIPEIPGLKDFEGPAFHTAQWDADFDWRGRNVAMIGTGASGHQVGPAIAPDVERLTIFQRSPHWIVPNPNYFEHVPDGVKWLLAHLPYYSRWYRFQLFWGFSDGLYSALQVDPAWDNPQRSINSTNDRHRRFMERHMRAELGEDSPLLSKVMPDYPPYGKRILIDNHWYKMLKRPNVDLVTAPIERVTAEGIETSDGKSWPADALVFATGFQASKMLAPMKIQGRGGQEIHQTWGEDDAQAYMGMTVPGYPNFFILLGPNTGLAHGGNAIFMTECQVRHVMACLRELIARRSQTIEVREDVSERYNQTVDRMHAGLVWTHPGVQSWYKNKQGRVFAISPWRLVEYWRMTGTVDRADYIFG
jgi:4-hydroxyacetophenone monooxygenase